VSRGWPPGDPENAINWLDHSDFHYCATTVYIALMSVVFELFLTEVSDFTRKF
jgi:hypothetical protein